MNDQRTKKLLFNKSSLLSLKAELLKKQEEVQEKKHLPQHRVDSYKPRVAKATSKNAKDKEEKINFKDNLKAVDTDELESCRKAKLALEKKAELYAHLSDGAGNSELSGRFLVDFNTKKQQEPEQHPGPLPDTDVYQDNEDDESDWTEFTDCLGRTRKCLKSDLELYMKRDNDLMHAVTIQQEAPSLVAPEIATPQVEKPLLVQKTNDYLQSLREKWEQKEQELLAKDKDIHYQDLLYDEARIHGVGYFSFSTEEAERQQQMEALSRQRQATLDAQREAEARRRRRDQLLAGRVAAARARQRARAGLPPEDPRKENEKDFTACLLEFLTQQKDEADAKAKEQDKKTKEAQEKERQKLRETYVRDWDIGKEGVEGNVKKFREMTQEEYVEQQRAKRLDEFAPMQGTSRDKSNYTFDNKGHKISTESHNSPPQPKSWSDVRPDVRFPPPPIISDIEPEQKGLFFSTKKSMPKPNLQYKNFVKAQESPLIGDKSNDDNQRHKEAGKRYDAGRSDSLHLSESLLDARSIVRTPPFPIERNEKNDMEPEEKGPSSSKKAIPKPVMLYRNLSQVQEPIPIDNEVSDDELEEQKETEKRRFELDHAEIAPPPTYEYYGPVPKKSKSQKPFVSDINEAFAQGTKSLQPKPSSGRLPQHYDFTFD